MLWHGAVTVQSMFPVDVMRSEMGGADIWVTASVCVHNMTRTRGS
jgi:hypothetical protein